MQDKKISIFFGDLVHNYLGAGSYMFPLNIGFLSAYAKKVFDDQIEIELFKYPDELLDAIRKNPPDVLSLSNYTWNSHLNAEVAGYYKEYNPDGLAVFGGPDININHDGYLQFFKSHPHADIYVLCEGELGFVNVISRFIASGKNTEECKKKSIDGTVIWDKGRILEAPLIDRIQDVNVIPSPYLTGTLDKFFKYNLIPIIETNRGCPFSCIFCAQGLTSRHAVKYFDMSRVVAELEYIAKHVKNTSILCFADANFGIHKRDFEIGSKINELRHTLGYPKSCTINWVKNRNSISIAEIMGQSVYLVSSLQSLDPVVLKIIKRQNVETSHFREIVDHVNEKGGVSGTEIILGLPGETKESHAKYLRELFNWGVSYIICYNCLLINGSEMTLPKYREKYRITTKFRLLDSAYGKYGGIISFEYEEGVRTTSTMSEADILYFRPVHWLIQFFWNYRAYYPVLKYCYNRGVNPYDFIIRVIESVDQAPLSVQEIIRQFQQEAQDEWFDSPEDLREHYTRNFSKLDAGEVGKLNAKYIWRVILECKQDFDNHILNTAKSFFPEAEDKLTDIVTFISLSLIDFTQIDPINNSGSRQFRYDILTWKGNNFCGEPVEGIVTYAFSLPDEKKAALNQLLHQYSHQNKNVTLRKMSEHIKFDYIYYEVSAVK